MPSKKKTQTTEQTRDQQTAAPEPTADGRIVDDNEANAIDAMNEEDMPERVPSTKNLPHLNKIELDEDQKNSSKKNNKKGKDSFDKAMDILDEYYDKTPPRNERFDHGGE